MEYKLKNCNDPRRKTIIYEINNSTNCWECVSHYITEDGYPKCWYKSSSKCMHRIVFITHFNIINLPSKLVVRHTCDNKLCINPAHLLIGTITDNNRDMFKRDRYNKKLTEKEVLVIRADTHNTNIALGQQYNISEAMVRHIKNKRRWSWL